MNDNPIKTLWDNDRAMREIESLRQQLAATETRLEEKTAECLSFYNEAETVIKQRDEARQQLASRDAEVAKWKDAYLKVVERIHMVGGYNDELADSQKQVSALQELAIWMTGCGYDFTKHEYYMERRHLLAATEPRSMK